MAKVVLKNGQEICCFMSGKFITSILGAGKGWADGLPDSIQLLLYEDVDDIISNLDCTEQSVLTLSAYTRMSFKQISREVTLLDTTVPIYLARGIASLTHGLKALGWPDKRKGLPGNSVFDRREVGINVKNNNRRS